MKDKWKLEPAGPSPGHIPGHLVEAQDMVTIYETTGDGEVIKHRMHASDARHALKASPDLFSLDPAPKKSVK